MRSISSRFLLLVIALALAGAMAPAEKMDLSAFSSIKARSIGPANMSGRIAAIDAVAANPNIIYVGASTGGVWKSENGGITWKPIFDEQSVASIGALAIFQKNPSIIWVGTGEGNLRNSVGVGRGVYRSTDGGRTWKCAGLEKTGHIARLLLDPDKPDVAYVAALGTTFGENPERGVFKTTDGGKTWDKVLYVDEKTGAADLAMDPHDPNKLIATMWQHRRWPWFFKSGGPGSGMHITVDGGKNWKKLTVQDGLPKGELGRIGVAFAASRPTIVYALVEAEKSCLLRSDDGGFSWRKVNEDRGINDRPFYYCDIRVNPVNENILYSLGTNLRVSEDGGRTLRSLATFNQSHSDYHAMWVHPDGESLMVGNDGGVVISNDRGKSWRFEQNLPLAQYYHVTVDRDLPYHVYGGLQDNGTWRGPGWLLTDRSINDYHWIMVGFGDGFDAAADPEDSSCGFGMSQGGNLFYWDIKTGRSRNARPPETNVKHRFNWNTGLALDPFHPDTLYYGSQFVHKSTDKGRTWEVISPDLTTNDPEKQKQSDSGGLTFDVSGAENHCTILAIAPSPVKEGVIWVGTDDGNVQLTTDGGKTWKLVSKSITGDKKDKVPPGSCVPHLEASPHDPATAFVVFENHMRADWTPYVFVTHDYGEKWESLATADIDGFCWVIKQDPVDPDLLFLGTEFCLYISIDGGQNWSRWTYGLPTVAVRDLAIQPRENDLVIATHGRGLYILDDISFLREAKPDVLKKKLHLFKMADATEFRTGSVTPWISAGDTAFRGANRPTGAWLTYLYKAEKPAGGRERGDRAARGQPGAAAGEPTKPEPGKETAAAKGAGGAEPPRRGLKIEILDAGGKVVRELEPQAEPPRGGFGFMDFFGEGERSPAQPTDSAVRRIYWDLRQKGLERPTQPGRETPGREQAAQEPTGRGRRTPPGLLVLPGNYTIRFTSGQETLSQTIQVKSDPRLKIDSAVLAENFKTAAEFQGWVEKFYKAQQEIDQAKKLAKTVSEYADNLPEEKKKELQGVVKGFEEKLQKLATEISPEDNRQGMVERSETLASRVSQAASALADAFEPLPQSALVLRDKAKTKLAEFLIKYNTFFAEEMPSFRQKVEAAGFTLFKTVPPLQLEEQSKQ